MADSLKFISALTAALVLTGCATDGDNSSGVHQVLTSSVADPIGALMIPPSNESALTYASTDTFDRTLHASMKGRVRGIMVTVPVGTPLTLAQINSAATGLTAGDQRMTRWTRRVKESGGALLACQSRPAESGLWAVLQLLLGVVSPILTDYLTYRPAGDYHAVIFYDSATDAVRGVKFIRRDAVADVSALTCPAAVAL
ncbi:hypothetical protein [Brevundimonas sp. GCM10030266]|uniref:hypothetical protein n=1 Tax=Brevundimonas sp. GCM10030266 TaxID=3273386 RepID=UPI00360ABC92